MSFTVAQAQAEVEKRSRSRIMGVLSQNSDKNFVQRILKPEGKPILDLGKGNFATHKMAWTTADGKSIVYPKVIQDQNTGKLIELSSKDAVQHALKNNEFITAKNNADAEWLSSNYKKVWNINGKNIKLKDANDPEFTPEEAQAELQRRRQKEGLIPQIREAGGVLPYLREAGHQVAAIPLGAAQEVTKLTGLPQAGKFGLGGLAGGLIPGQVPQPTVGAEAPARTGRALTDIGAFTGVAALTGGAGEAAGVPAVLARLAGQTAGGAAITPRHRLLGALAGLTGGVGAETIAAVPKLAVAGLRKLQKIAAPALFEPIAKRIGNIAEKLRGGETSDNLNPEVFNRAKQNYEETRGITRDGFKERPLENDQYNFRNPGDSSRAKFDRVRELAKGRIARFNKQSWNDAILGAEEKIKTRAKQFPNDPDLLDSQKFLDRIKGWRLNSLGDAMDMTPKLNEEWFKASKGDNRELTSLINPLKEGVKEGMKKTADQSPVVRQAFDTATQDFKSDIIPFRQFAGKKTRFISEYNKPSPNTDNFIEAHVKPGKTELLSSFMKQLPNQESRDLVTAHVFDKVKDNPVKFINQYSKYNQAQRKLLFPNDWEHLNQAEKLFKQLPQAFKPAEKTGVLGKLARRALAVGGGASALHGNLLTGALLASPFLTRQATLGAARIPAVRQKLLQSLLRQATEQATKRTPGIGANIALGGLIGELGRRQRGNQ